MMNDNPHLLFSGITEETEMAGLDHFLAALSWGILAGTAALMVPMLIASGFDVDLTGIAGALVFVALFVGIFTLASLVVIGLPLTLILSALERESAAVYATAGALAGFTVLAVVFEIHRVGDPGMLWLPAIGAFAGSVCALRWGRWREAVARRRAGDRQETPPVRRSNPIHDLIH